MIIEGLFWVLLSVLSFLINLVSSPFRLFFPAVVSLDGLILDLTGVVVGVIRTTFNLFAYFSSVQVARSLFFFSVLFIFSYPVLKFVIGAFKFFRKLF